MHFDIVHISGKARAQALHNRRQLRLEKAVRTRIQKALDAVFAEAAAHARHGVFDVEHVVNRHRHALQRIVGNHYAAVGQYFLGTVEEAYARRQSHGKKDDSNRLETKGMAEEFWQAFHNWAAGDAFQEVTLINNATKSVLRRVLRRQADSGGNYDTTATAILDKAKQLNPMRATRIARTETHRASTYAVNEAVKSTRVKFDREWVSMADDRTRPEVGAKVTRKNPWDHRKANGQRRGMNEPFDVSGEKLMFPGDPKGSAGNTINCRCVLIYVPARSAVAWT